jgi:hypothetical protein
MTPATAAARAAQTAPARRAPARRSPAPARRRTAPAPARAPHLVPIAVGRRTAAAVSNLADTGLLHRLTRGRLWIGMLTTLLVGIVALNVMELSFGASASSYGRQADILKRENSTLTTRLSTATADHSLQRTAGRDGLIQPAPGSIRYLDLSSKNAAIAAKRLSSGALTYGAAVDTSTETSLVPPPTTTTDTVTTDPTATTTTTDPAATTVDPATTSADPTTTTPVTTTPTTTTPATTASTTPASGGVAAP